jgi:thioester reductase-like protein
MSTLKRILVTGATGFVGSHLAYRLLGEGCHVTVLARGAKNAPAQDRVLEVLTQVGACWNGAEALKTHLDRLEVVEGDIARPGLGIAEPRLTALAAATDETWHCAASLSFTQEDRDEIFRMNVGGTRHLLDVIGKTRGRRLQHVSTAYVAGRKEVALETEVDTGQRFRNAYEESKCQAELLVAAAHAGGSIRATIHRPSIVIGDSRTGRTTHFHGVYAFIRGLWTALERLRRKQAGTGPVNLPLRVLGNETTTLNFVPIEYVINGMIHIGKRADSIGGTYHLTNPFPVENRVWLSHICGLLGVEGIRFVDESSFAAAPMTKLEALFQKQMAFYYMYLQGEPRFDCSQTLKALSGTAIECPRLTGELIEKMLGWYIRHLQES